MAGRLGIERESVYRIERKESLRAKWQAAYAAALGYDDPAILWRLPDPALPKAISAEDAKLIIENVAADVLRRLAGDRR